MQHRPILTIPVDIPVSRKILRTGAILGSLLGFGIITVWAISRFGMAIGMSSTASYQTELVVRAAFEDKVSAYGELRSLQLRSLVTEVAGTLQSIAVQPGERISKDSPILQLSNTLVQRDYQLAELELQEQQANLAQLDAELSDQYLNLRNERELVRAELSTQLAEFEARQKLAEMQIVSQLELNKEQMKLEQIRLRVKLADDRLQTFEKTRLAKTKAANLRLSRAVSNLDMRKADVDALTVRAGMDGVLQNLNEELKLGQWLNQNISVGIVTNPHQMYAELRVSAADAARLVSGQPLMVNINGQQVAAVVSRIAPSVVRNQVQIDATFQAALPDSARPDIEVSAMITVTSEQDVLVINRPAHFHHNQPLALYVADNHNTYSLRQVMIASYSSRQLVIKEGLNEGDLILLDDPAGWAFKNSIKIP